MSQEGMGYEGRERRLQMEEREDGILVFDIQFGGKY